MVTADKQPGSGGAVRLRRGPGIRIRRMLSVGALLALLAQPAGLAAHREGRWRTLERGLEMGTFKAPRASEAGDSMIRVLRIDPRAFELRLLNASAPGQGRPLTARQWCARNGLVGAINASMYQTDYRTSVSLMKTRFHTNNRRLSKDRAVLAFDSLDPSLPQVQIIDFECQDFGDIGKRYGTLVQSIRMVSCKGGNVWSQQPRKWSTAAIGLDGKGKVLFIHVRSPYSTHDLIDMLLRLPIGLKRAMYVEGGPEAQLYVRGGGKEFEFVGIAGTGIPDYDEQARAWAVPNVIGVARRVRSTALTPP